MHLCSRCHCNIYLYKDDGIYRTRSPKTRQRRYVWTYADITDPLFRPEYKWFDHEFIHKWYGHIKTDDQPGNSSGIDVIFHDHCNIYFYVSIKSDFNDSCSCCYRNHDHGDKSDWWKQRKILYPPAKIISRCDRIYRRENEWTESCQSL